MTTPREGFVDRLKDYERLVEIGVGRRPDVAATLVERGHAVTATDITGRDVPEGIDFVLDDVTDPDTSVYAGADAVYGRNLPPELHRPARDVARECDAEFLFTTLGGDQPVIPVEREMLPQGETLYLATENGPGTRRE